MAITEIDYMEYSSDANAQAAYVSNSFYSNADIDSEDMADITDWTDGSYGTAATSQVTFDSKSCMKLDSGISTGAAAQSGRLLDIGSFQARTVFSFSSYCDAIGTQAQADYLEAYFYDGATCFYVIFCSDGVKVYDGVTYNEVGTDLVVQDSWQEWKFDVNWTAQTVDVYLGGILQASGVDCSWAQGTAEGTVRFNQRGYTTANRISYVDWFKAGDGALITATLSYTQSEDDVAYIMASFNEVVSETPVTVCPGVMYLESA